MQEEQRRMKIAVTDVLNDIDRKCLRTLQIQMYQCAIECCKDNSKSIESVEKCNENCSRQVISSRKYVQDEFNNWQKRVHRCVQSCDDAVSDRMPRSSNRPNASEMNVLIREAEACASDCIAKHMKLLPQLSDKVVDNVLNRKML